MDDAQLSSFLSHSLSSFSSSSYNSFQIIVSVLEARGLENHRGIFGSTQPDTFASVLLDGKQLFQTGTARRSTSPFWNETFIIELNSTLPSSVIEVRLWKNSRKLKALSLLSGRTDKFLGKANINITSLIERIQHPNLTSSGSVSPILLNSWLTLRSDEQYRGARVSGEVHVAFSLTKDILEKVSPLPVGWSQTIDSSGNAIFLDHNTRTATHIDPRLIHLLPHKLRTHSESSSQGSKRTSSISYSNPSSTNLFSDPPLSVFSPAISNGPTAVASLPILVNYSPNTTSLASSNTTTTITTTTTTSASSPWLFRPLKSPSMIKGRWMWRTDDGTWNFFCRGDSKAIEEAFLTHQNKVILNNNGRVDVKNRQHSTTTGEKRVIMRGTWFWVSIDGHPIPFPECVATEIDKSYAAFFVLGQEEKLVIHVANNCTITVHDRESNITITHNVHQKEWKVLRGVKSRGNKGECNLEVEEWELFFAIFTENLTTTVFKPPKITREGSFEDKVHKLRSKFELLMGETEIHVRREHLFSDSFKVITSMEVSYLKRHLKIRFDQEEGLDYGGISRDWFFLLSKEIFNPYYKLFESTSQYLLQVNPQSSSNTNDLLHFQFSGMILGMALYHSKLIDGCYFTRPFYKMLLNRPVVLEDLRNADPEFYSSLKWLIENDVNEDMGFTFSQDVDEWGEIKEIELKPGGVNISVTNQNKLEYVELMVQWRVTRGVSEQMEAIKRGFQMFIEPEWLSRFDEREIELLLCGVVEVDENDWKLNTINKGWKDDDDVIKWFWQLVHEMSHDERSRLLHFATGSPRVPGEGFQGLVGANGPQLFTIQKLIAPVDSLPCAHTCFNRLELSAFSCKDIMTKKLKLAIYNSEGYDIQ